jgi:MoxR-like ATPase
MVIATQNPIEVHGTFPLPQSQLDRFMMRLTMGYPGREAEIEVLREQVRNIDFSTVEPLIHGSDVVRMQDEVTRVHISDALLEYLSRIVTATREAQDVELGVSTRGALALRNAAKAHAWYFGRDYVIADDIKLLCPLVLGHRLQLAQTFDGFGSGWARGERPDQAVVERLLESIPVPV